MSMTKNTDMFSELLGVDTVRKLETFSIKLLDKDNIQQLQDNMVKEQVILYSTDAWTPDVTAKLAASPEKTQATLNTIANEECSVRVLHILQLAIVIAPGAADNIRHFLERVTFA